MSNIDVGLKNNPDRIKWLQSKLSQLPAGDTILDAGAGEEQFKQFCGHLKYISQDFCQYDGRGNSEGLQPEKWNQQHIDIISDITDIPKTDGFFDAIMCIEVLEHLPKPLLAIKEFNRLLKKGGNLILTAPFCSLTHYAPFHFYSGFNRYFFETILPEYGFEILEIVENGNFFEYLGQEVRRIPGMSQRYCTNNISDHEHSIINQMVALLDKLSSLDTGSKETLCFDFHIFSRKV